MARPSRTDPPPHHRPEPVPGNEAHNGGGTAPESGPEVPAAEVQAELERILASKGFVHSDRLSRFLRFTVQRALQGEGASLKEYLIGMEVFDRNGQYDPRNDPIVRVEAGRLRAKLKEFYETEGREDAVIIDFQKGSYVPVFQRRERLASPAAGARLLEAARDWKTAALAIALLLAGLAASRAVISSRQNLALQKELEAAKKSGLGPEFTAVWGKFLTPGTETYVVFGSPIFFANEGAGYFVRFSGMNDASRLLNDPAFQKMQERFGPLTGPRYDYALMGDAVALQRLTEFFGGAGRTLKALPAHQASWDAIKGGNIIFLGAPRMIPLLQHLPVQQDFEWGPDHSIRNRNPRPGEQEIYTTPSHWNEASYAVVAAFPGLLPDREVLLLTAHSAPGTLAAVEYLTRAESVRALAEKLQLAVPGKPRHYQLLLRVLVDQGAPVKSEYVTHHPVPPSTEKR